MVSLLLFFIFFLSLLIVHYARDFSCTCTYNYVEYTYQTLVNGFDVVEFETHCLETLPLQSHAEVRRGWGREGRVCRIDHEDFLKWQGREGKREGGREGERERE